MKTFKILLLTVISALLMAGCENSQPKKTAEIPTPNMQTAASTDAPSGRAIRPPSAEKAPDFEAKDIHGKTIKLSDYKGKVVILDFWATWCPPCKAEIPFFIELENQYKKDGLVILGAALDTQAKVTNFYKNNGMNYSVFIAEQDLSMTYGGVQGIPTTFIIDRDGYIRDKFVGFRPKQVFEDAFLSLK